MTLGQKELRELSYPHFTQYIGKLNIRGNCNAAI